MTMILKLSLSIAIFSSLGLATPQFQAQYGVPYIAPAREIFPTASFPAAPIPAAPFPAAPFPAAPFPPAPISAAPIPVVPLPAATQVSLGVPVQEDAGSLELLPPLQHVVGTRYPAVRPGRGYKFPISQLLNPTPPPNLKH